MLGARLPVFSPSEQSLVRHSSDFFGLNTYTTNLIKAPSTSSASDEFLTNQAPDELPDSTKLEVLACVADTQVDRDGKLIGKRSEAVWLVDCPWGFRKLLRYINEVYIRDSGLIILITENGFPVRPFLHLSHGDVARGLCLY
jgi:beta-glucosidase